LDFYETSKLHKETGAKQSLRYPRHCGVYCQSTKINLIYLLIQVTEHNKGNQQST
jgi:hypothetical protein